MACAAWENLPLRNFSLQRSSASALHGLSKLMGNRGVSNQDLLTNNNAATNKNLGSIDSIYRFFILIYWQPAWPNEIFILWFCNFYTSQLGTSQPAIQRTLENAPVDSHDFLGGSRVPLPVPCLCLGWLMIVGGFFVKKWGWLRYNNQ